MPNTIQPFNLPQIAHRLKPITVMGSIAVLIGMAAWSIPSWATANVNPSSTGNNTFLASPTTAIPKKQVVTILPPSFNTQLGELWIESQPHSSLEARYVDQSPSKKHISFWILNAALPNGAPVNVPVEPDPIIKGIKLEPRVTEGVPSVFVQVDLYTSSPYVPFALMPLSQGLKVSVGKTPTSMTQYRDHAPVVHTASVQPAPAQTIPATQPAQPISMMATTMVATPAPTKIAANLPRTTTDVPIRTATPVKATAPVTRLALATPSGAPTQYKPGSWIGSMGTKAIINDIYFDSNALKLVSTGQPLVIKKQFSLFQPSRYVMDVAPAVLPSAKGLARVIPENNTGILSIRASQFEPDTVRIVVQFQKDAIPLSLNQSPDKHILSLQF